MGARRNRCYLSFDGNDKVTVSNIDAPSSINKDIEAFTIAASYRSETSNGQKELIEHISGGKNWFITTRWNKYDNAADEYRPEFKTGPGGGCSNCIDGGVRKANDQHVVVGTFDGTESEMYVDGTALGTKRGSQQPISMGTVTIGQDGEGNYQHYCDKIYEIRLYYRVLDRQAVQAVTKAMS